MLLFPQRIIAFEKSSLIDNCILRHQVVTAVAPRGVNLQKCLEVNPQPLTQPNPTSERQYASILGVKTIQSSQVREARPYHYR